MTKAAMQWQSNMTNGRAKGAAFEREVAKLIDEHLGIKVERDLEQYRKADRGDLIGLDGWTIECKRYASTRGSNGGYRPEWWEQATKAANAAHNQPVLIYKYDRQPIRCVVLLSSISPDYAGKDNTATISLSTWFMLVRESL